MAPVPVRPSRSHHAATLHKTQQKTSPAKPGAKKPLPAKPEANQRGKSPSSGASTGKTPHAAPRARNHRPAPADNDTPDPPTIYKANTVRRGRAPATRLRVHVPAPAPLKGSHEILVHQNIMADDEGLERIEDDETLDEMRAGHELVDLPAGRSLYVSPDLPANRRCARPWTVKFAEDTARAFYARFGQPLKVSSAVRTVAYQQRLQQVNGNAAAVDGDAASPHLTGQAIDLAKRDMTRAQLAWMRSRLVPLIEAGKIDVEEEFQQSCFHISVYRSYLPTAKKRLPTRQIAQVHPAPIVREYPAPARP